MADNEEAPLKQKLSDDEKSRLISFYKDNKELWSSSVSCRREKKCEIKEELVNLFDGAFTEGFLDKNFHALRTAYNRESKKLKQGKEPKKKMEIL